MIIPNAIKDIEILDDIHGSWACEMALSLDNSVAVANYFVSFNNKLNIHLPDIALPEK